MPSFWSLGGRVFVESELRDEPRNSSKSMFVYSADQNYRYHVQSQILLPQNSLQLSHSHLFRTCLKATNRILQRVAPENVIEAC
jgi:hypothetical protein